MNTNISSIYGKKTAISVFVIVGLIFPFVTEGTYLLHLLILSYFWATMTVAYNLLMGYTGLLSLGHATFYALGGYASAIITKDLGYPWPLGMAAALILTAVLSALLGVLVLRLKGAYFAMVTFGLAEITRHILENWESLTGGVYGILKVPELFESIRATYIFAFLLMLACYIFVNKLLHTGVGRAFIANRENEDLARSVGINLAHFRLLAFIISGGICGVVGAAMAHYQGMMIPDSAHFLNSAALLVYTVAGGAGYLIGPGLAAAFFIMLPEFSRTVGNIQLLIYGMVLVLVIVLIPGGLEPVFRRMIDAFKNRFSSQTAGGN